MTMSINDQVLCLYTRIGWGSLPLAGVVAAKLLLDLQENDRMSGTGKSLSLMPYLRGKAVIYFRYIWSCWAARREGSVCCPTLWFIYKLVQLWLQSVGPTLIQCWTIQAGHMKIQKLFCTCCFFFFPGYRRPRCWSCRSRWPWRHMSTGVSSYLGAMGTKKKPQQCWQWVFQSHCIDRE